MDGHPVFPADGGDTDDVGPKPDISAMRFKISINDRIVDKTVADTSWYAVGWQNVELSRPEFITTIANGSAYCAQLSGPRRTENFVETNVASVDIDHGMTLTEALTDPLITGHALFLYTTPSHTADKNRFRVVFALPRSIDKASDIRAISTALALRLSGDPAAVDATRIFFGHRKAVFTEFGHSISGDLMEDLLAQGKALSDTNRTRQSQRSRVQLPISETIRLADGTATTLGELSERAPIFCPFHADDHASAFVVRSQRGTTGIHCSTCAQTYWPSGSEQYPFDHFDKEVKAAAEASDRAADLRSTKISIVSGQPVPSAVDPGLTFIKSFKGSGKTEGIARLARQESKVLLVGHRRLLIRQSAKRLDLTAYLDRDFGESRGTLMDIIFEENEGAPPRYAKPWKGRSDPRLDRFAVSLDSIELVPANMDYNLIVIDESEQVLAHFLSETLSGNTGDMRDRRDALFNHMSNLVKRAKSVVALDADLGWVSYLTLSRMRTPDAADIHPTETRHVWLNEGQPGDGKTIQIFQSEHALTADLIASVTAGKKCLVASTSKDRVNKLAASIAATIPEARILVVTSDTGQQAEVKRFIANPAARMMDYDLVLSSPSLGTGVDITFPMQGQMVDVVYGFCGSDVQTHLEFDQQLARVRNPKEVKIWISPRRANFETHLDVVRNDIRSQSLYRNVIIGYDEHGDPRYREDDPFVEMASLINSQRRASLNDLHRNYIRYKEAEGFTFVYVGKNAESASEGAAIMRLGRELDDNAFASQMLAAGVLGSFRFERVEVDLKNESIVPDDEKWAFQRTRLERFYRQKATADLIKLDDRSRFRSRVVLFGDVRKELVAAEAVPRDTERARSVPSPEIKRAVLAELLRSTSLIRAGDFDREREIQSNDLAPFIAAVLAQRGVIETQIGRSIRGDLEAKPVQQLNEFLSLIGMKLVQTRSVKRAGTVTRFYKLDVSRLERMDEIVRRREEIGGWEALDRLYGRYVADEDEWVVPRPG